MFSLPRSAPVAVLLVFLATGGDANASPIVSGQINDVDGFLSNNLFQFENESTAGEEITSIKITIPSAFFFDVTSAAPGVAPSGPTVSGASDLTTPVFSVTDGTSELTVSFSDFEPGELFLFGLDLDSFATPDDSVRGSQLAGTLVTVTFSNGSVFQGEFVDVDGTLTLQQLVPEPTTLALVGIGGLVVAGAAYRRRKHAANPA